MSIGEKGEKLYQKGYNCAEAVARVSHQENLVNLSEDCLKATSVFGGGIANCGEICGALSGGLVVLSAKYGRMTTDKKTMICIKKQ